MQISNKNHKKRAVLIVSGLIICFLAIALHTSTYLTISEYGVGGHKKGLMIPAESNDSFALEYMHSVLKTQVIDFFRIAGQERIVLEETTYESLGIGLPSDTPYEFSLSDRKFHIRGINQAMPHILLRVGRIANHQLLVQDKKIPLKEYFPPETLLKIKVEESCLYEYWLREK